MNTRLTRALAAGAAVMLLATACAGSNGGSTGGDAGTDEPTTGGTHAVNEDARALLPASVRDSGTLKVATSLTWAPFDYKDENGEATGIEIGLMEAVGEVLGVKIEVTDIDWQSLVPSVANGRFDVSMNQLEDTEDRRKQAQFVHYYKDSIAVLTKAGVDIDPENLCGHQIAVTQGSSQQGTVERISQECVDAGKEAIKVEVFAESAATILAVQNNRAESMLMGKASGVYLQQTDASDLQVSEGYVPGTEALTGLVVEKSNDELAAALQAALQTLLEDGWYQEYLGTYGVESGALEEITIGKG
ncbi:transporter substrate-binding domain-containing protein [Leucobacter soli]|uniref:transporter substrate-binding domain-containing protein n=1 Tax=Leucobacter soli TaxID=2812850 RepID=UPI003609F1AF